MILSILALLLIVSPVVPTHAAPQDQPRSNLVAGWLARSLAGTNDLALSPTGEIDYASTAYAILAMRGTGFAGTQISASAEAMASSGEDFISTPDQIGLKTTAIALMILAQQIADLDPSNHITGAGTRDLYADLTSAINTDGSISEMPSAYGQSLAILALLTSGSPVPQATIEWLLAQPCTDPSSPGYGGFGFAGPGSCDDADPDSTALSVIALKAAGVDSATLVPSATYLTTVQDSSGGFISPWSGPNANTTGLALAALNYFGTDYKASIDQGLEYLNLLVYGCEFSGEESTAGLVGAMAFNTDNHESSLTSVYIPEVQAELFQASAQGLFGLLGFMPVTGTSLPTLSKAIPSASDCASTLEPSTHEPGSAIPSGLWWVIGGILIVVVVALLAWKFLLPKRK